MASRALENSHPKKIVDATNVNMRDTSVHFCRDAIIHGPSTMVGNSFISADLTFYAKNRACSTRNGALSVKNCGGHECECRGVIIYRKHGRTGALVNASRIPTTYGKNE